MKITRGLGSDGRGRRSIAVPVAELFDVFTLDEFILKAFTAPFVS